ncbi:MAG: SsrA-binding protein SmpB [Deltaproteobacteria bacterium]|nr:SsrA-binding protein SmpB [Deltaproteobacteria bacterium]
MKIISTNREAKFQYHLEERFEAGLILVGAEVKSLREGKVNLKDSFARFKGDELYLMNCHISAYSHARIEDLEARRDIKLLLQKAELHKIMGKVREKGYTLIPTQLYFNQRGFAKVEIALAHGKKKHDKREDIKRREVDRELKRMLKK